MSIKSLDLSKFRREQNKKHGIRDGFFDPITWISTGNYALNKMISDNFWGGIPIGSVTCFAGESGCLPGSAEVRIRDQDGNERAVTVGELREIYHSRTAVWIDTPDGFQRLIRWYDKGVLPMIEIKTENGHTTRCAWNHMMQMSNNMWRLADHMIESDVLYTISGLSPIVSKNTIPDEACFDFEVDYPKQRYWGDGISSHNSGKSYIVSGNIVKHALEQGVNVILLDSEDAVKRKWAEALGVDPDHPNLARWNKNTINQVALVISDFMKDYIEIYNTVPREEQTPVLFVIDSLGNLNSDTEAEQFAKGDLKGDKGIKAKGLKMLVTNCIRLFSGFQVGLVCTNHTYKSQNMYDPEDVLSGGSGPVYASDIVVSLNKLKLKEDAEGNKVKEILGIRSKAKVAKSRYAKPFEEVEVHIPWDSGMDPYSGLFDFFENKGVLVKDGNRYRYDDIAGNEHKLYRKHMTAEFFEMIMREFDEKTAKLPAPVADSDDELDDPEAVSETE